MLDNKKETLIRYVKRFAIKLPRSTLCKYTLRGFKNIQIYETEEETEEGQPDHMSSWLICRK